MIKCVLQTEAGPTGRVCDTSDNSFQSLETRCGQPATANTSRDKENMQKGGQFSGANGRTKTAEV